MTHTWMMIVLLASTGNKIVYVNVIFSALIMVKIENYRNNQIKYKHIILDQPIL